LFVAFLAYGLSTTLRQRLRVAAGGLLPRVVFEKLATVQPAGRDRADNGGAGIGDGPADGTIAGRAVVGGTAGLATARTAATAVCEPSATFTTVEAM